jgi:hypothetical protein
MLASAGGASAIRAGEGEPGRIVVSEEPSTPSERIAENVATVGSRLTTAAGAAGLIFAVLFTVAFALLRVGVPPAETAAYVAWYETSRDRLVAGTYLLPFVGIAFLWFVAAVRQRIGRGEGFFFSTIFIGSALLFVAMLFVTGAAAGAALTSADTLDTVRAREIAAFGQSFAYAAFFWFTVKMEAMFMLVVASIGRETGALPRWLILPSAVLGIVLLLAVSIWEPTALVFPAWVAVVSLIIIRFSLARADGERPR